MFFNFFKRKPVVAIKREVPRCKVLHREYPRNEVGVFIEIRRDGSRTIYCSMTGVSPAYYIGTYDDWCRDTLSESYVFESIDKAMDYFKEKDPIITQEIKALKSGLNIR